MKKYFVLIVMILFITKVSLLAENNETNSSNAEDQSSAQHIWDSSLILGMQVLPRYSDDGQHEGLKDTRLFAKLNLDSRWYRNEYNNTADHDFNLKSKDGWNLVFNSGIDLEFLGTPVTDKNQTSIDTPTSFTDVSDTLQALFYFQVIPSYPSFNISKYSDIGFIMQLGGLTRDQKDEDESTLNKFYSYGVQYTFFEKVSFVGDQNNIYEKKYPAAKFLLLKRDYDYFAGKKDAGRYVIDLEYQLIKEKSFYVGVNSNFGPGADVINLKFALYTSLDKVFGIFDIFNVNK